MGAGAVGGLLFLPGRTKTRSDRAPDPAPTGAPRLPVVTFGELPMLSSVLIALSLLLLLGVGVAALFLSGSRQDSATMDDPEDEER